MPATEAQIAREADRVARPSFEAAAKVQTAWSRFDRLEWRQFKSDDPAIAATVVLVVDGEVPSAATRRYADGSSYISINSGLVYFLDDICRATTRGLARKPSLKWQEVDPVLLDAFERWRNGKRPAGHFDAQLDPAAEPTADELFAWAMIFVVLTEFGRVTQSETSPVDDDVAIRWAASVMCRLASDDALEGLAGGLVTMSAREIWGEDSAMGAVDLSCAASSKIYFNAVRQTYPDDISFFLKTASVLSLASRVAVTARAARGSDSQLPNSPHLILSLVVAELVAVSEGNSAEQAAKTIESFTADADEALLSGVADLCGAVFSIEQPSYWNNGGVRSLVDSLPSVVKWMSRKARERLTTQAQRDLFDEFDNFPGRQAAESMGRAFALMSYRKWTTYKEQFPALRSTVILVVNKARPFAQTKQHYSDGSTFICINEGLLFYIQAVCRMLSGSIVTVSAGGIVETAALDPASVDQALLNTYRQWETRLRAGIVEPPDDLLLRSNVEELADSFFLAAMLFNFMHEVGHAALHRGLQRDPATHELEADKWAVKALFEVFAQPTDQENFVLGGALLILRAFAARERLPEFKVELEGYPPSQLRFQQMIDEVRPFFPDEICFYTNTTVAFTHDMRMESAENALLGRNLRPPSRPEQFASSIVAMLIAVMRRQARWTEVVKNVNFTLSQSPPELIDATARICGRIFSASQPSYKMFDDIPRLVRRYRSLLKRLPADNAMLLRRRKRRCSSGISTTSSSARSTP